MNQNQLKLCDRMDFAYLRMLLILCMQPKIRLTIVLGCVSGGCAILPNCRVSNEGSAVSHFFNERLHQLEILLNIQYENVKVLMKFSASHTMHLNQAQTSKHSKVCNQLPPIFSPSRECTYPYDLNLSLIEDVKRLHNHNGRGVHPCERYHL